MGTQLHALAAVLLAASLAACDRAAPAAQAEASTVVTPAVVAVRETIEAAVPIPPASPATDPAAVDLIVRYEVSSPSYYAARLQAPVWPGEQSGVTWGVGYDGGQQTRTRIADDWHMHPAVSRLVETSGIAGPPARAIAAQLHDIITPYPMAEQVFATSTLPAFQSLTARTFHNGWETLPPPAQGALTATIYNRGASMAGDRRRELRTLRDTCVPAHDTACMAAQFRSMTRLWAGTSIDAGMRARYEATAQLALSGSTSRSSP